MTVVGEDFLFIHVPKCAGKSLSRRLGGVTKGIPSHAPLSYFSKDFLAGRFTFGFVRNPWDRMVSSYVFITTKVPRKNDDVLHRELATRLGFKRWLLETEHFLGHERQEPLLSLPPYQRRSQMHWLEGCDFIGRTETIDADLKIIEAKIKRSKTLVYRTFYAGPLQKRNTTKRLGYQRYYDDEAHDFVAMHAAPEIERFGYRFNVD